MTNLLDYGIYFGYFDVWFHCKPCCCFSRIEDPQIYLKSICISVRQSWIFRAPNVSLNGFPLLEQQIFGYYILPMKDSWLSTARIWISHDKGKGCRRCMGCNKGLPLLRGCQLWHKKIFASKCLQWSQCLGCLCHFSWFDTDLVLKHEECITIQAWNHRWFPTSW